ncbi:hypothetical protein [Aeromonas salmonicida]|uniref:hypothetical protein n=1 Tax=Aeromonas salmonicida TaxID=645 RepID=UPI0030DC93FC
MPAEVAELAADVAELAAAVAFDVAVLAEVAASLALVVAVLELVDALDAWPDASDAFDRDVLALEAAAAADSEALLAWCKAENLPVVTAESTAFSAHF